MTTTLTDGITTVTPTLMLGYSHTRRSGNVMHELVDADAAVPSLKPAGLRTGSFTLMFAVQADAFAADTLHAAGVELTLTDDEVPAVDMTYVLGEGDAVTLEQDDERVAWLLSVDYVEVAT